MPNADSPPRPNILLILVDDMGYSDIGCFGSEIATPNLDRLAGRGIRFTQAYNCGRCCPTRASLLTGLYPHQAGVGDMVGDHRVGPAYQGYLRGECVTLAEALRDAGYGTYLSGKWHVGGPYAGNKPETWQAMGDAAHPAPCQRGFDRFYGMLGGAGSYFNPPYLACDNSLIRPEGEQYYLTDAIAENAADMIDRAADAGRPFFLYAAFTAPHWPLHALPEDIARYEGRYRRGWDAVRTARHERLKALGILDPRWPISPRDDDAPPWEDLDPARRDWEDLRMAVYAAQVDRMDRGVGRILAALHQRGLDNNTLVIFLSDNGGCAEFLAEDTGQKEPFRYNVPTRDGRPIRVGNIPGLRPGPDDTFMSYDLPWANASNTPFRKFKKWVHEGGVATPLIASWPAAIAPGGLCHSPLHVADILPTCLAAAAAHYPAEHHGLPIPPAEGESFLPALRGASWRRQQPIFFEHEGNRAVRHGPWKLVSCCGRPWELYDMAADRTELTDLAGKNAPKSAELQAAYHNWANRCGVIPWERLTRKR